MHCVFFGHLELTGLIFSYFCHMHILFSAFSLAHNKNRYFVALVGLIFPGVRRGNTRQWRIVFPRLCGLHRGRISKGGGANALIGHYCQLRLRSISGNRGQPGLLTAFCLRKSVEYVYAKTLLSVLPAFNYIFLCSAEFARQMYDGSCRLIILLLR